ncbi:MAG: hypothetical protein ACM3N9_08310 [Syntrophothermus sp.]
MAQIDLEIRQVKGKKDLEKFIDFPFQLYRDHPYWCPSLKFDDRNTFSRKKNPAFEVCDAEYWLAIRDGKTVGRVAGIINYQANGKWKEDLVRFGWIDFIDDQDVSAALVTAVEEWGKSKGMKGIHGPLGFTDMDAEGMLIEGFEQLSALSAIYNYPYYPEHFVRLGFVKAVDWVQYKIPVPAEIPEKIARLSSLVAEKYSLELLHTKSKKELLPYARKLLEMQNVAFRDLYGYAALTDRQMDLYTNQYFGFIRREFVSLVLDKNKDVIAFGVTIPSLTRALQKSKGKLLPFGFIHLLRALKNNDAIHMYLVGVRPDFHGKGVLAMIFDDLHRQYLTYGIKMTTTHPQLEENFKALSIWKNYEGEMIIRRRCWVRYF